MALVRDTSETGIVNGALAHLQVDAIADVNDTLDLNATRAKFHYPRVRDPLQRGFRWNFNKARASLAADGTAPIFEYSAAFRLPSDCIAVREVYGHAWEAWEVEEDRRLLINASAPLQITYSRLITDPARFDSLFVKVFEYELAIVLAPLVARDEGLKARLIDQLADVRRPARIADGRESKRFRNTNSRFLAARQVGG